MADATSRTPWPRAWTWAIVLTVGLFGAHATTRWWFAALIQTLFGSVPESFSEVTPGVGWLIVGWVVLSLAGGVGISVLIGEGGLARDRDRQEQEHAEWQRLRAIRDQLWLESLPPESRERVLAQRRERAELEARARAIFEAEQRVHAGKEPS